MITLNTDVILVPMDFSLAAKKAIEHAAFLAQLNKGEVVLLHVMSRKKITSSSHTISDLRYTVLAKHDADTKLNKIAAEIHKKYGIPVKKKIVFGSRINGILESAEQLKAGLIVMGTQGYESTSNLLRGSNSTRVVLNTNIPVMTIRAQANKKGYSRILLPVDLSDHSRQKVNLTLQLAKLFSAKVFAVGMLSADDNAHKYKLEVILNQISKKAQEKNVLIETEIVSSWDAAAETIEIAQKKRADLIVAMTDDQSSLFSSHGFDEELVNDSEIPVLSLPPELQEESFDSISIAGY